MYHKQKNQSSLIEIYIINALKELINSLMLCFLLFLTRNFLCKKVNQVFLQFLWTCTSNSEEKKESKLC